MTVATARLRFAPLTAAAIYARISRDRVGAGLGVDRQEEDCRALCERNDWPVVETFRDNDVSAYSGKPRPGYAAHDQHIGVHRPLSLLGIADQEARSRRPKAT